MSIIDKYNIQYMCYQYSKSQVCIRENLHVLMPYIKNRSRDSTSSVYMQKHSTEIVPLVSASRNTPRAGNLVPSYILKTIHIYQSVIPFSDIISKIRLN